MPGNLQSALTEGDRRHLPVDPCQSKWLTSLGIAKWQTVVLLFSVMLTSEYWVESSFTSLTLTESDSSYAKLFVNSALCINCCQINLIVH